ncbi:MAG: FAD-binding oxidoreductase [Acidimicrobiia bacterium]
MDNAEVISRLREIASVLDSADGAALETFLVDGRNNHGEALCIVSPNDLSELKAVVKFCVDNDIKIVPQGARTGLVGASVPLGDDARNCVIVSMEKYRMPIVYNNVDGRVLVSAGMHLEEVNEFLQPHGVKVAIDISVDPSFGGMAATNVGGSSVVRYGNFRDMTTGVEVVLADSETSLYSTINRPVKDNSKLDFTGTFIGSGGALGVISRVELKTFPLIGNSHCFWIKLDKDRDISDLLIKIKSHFGEKLLSCEFVSHEALEAIAISEEQQQSNVSLPFGDDTSVDSIFVEFESGEQDFDIDEQAQSLVMEFLEAVGIDDVVFVDTKNTWDIRHRMSDAVRVSGQKLIGCDISTTANNVFLLRTRIREKLDALYPDLTVADFGHLGDGGLHMNVVVPFGTEFDEGQVLDVRKAISDEVMEIGGSISAEHGRGLTNRPVLQQYFDPVGENLFASLKDAVDPFNILGHNGTAPFIER